MPAPLTSREDAVARLSREFRRRGYEGASVKTLSKATGLGASSLYNYFPGGKEEMGASVLSRSRAWLVAEVVAPLTAAGDPRGRVRAAARALHSYYDGGHLGCLLAIFGTDEARRTFRGQLQGDMRALIAAFAAAARDAGRPPQVADRTAEDAVAAIQGALVIARVLEDPAVFLRVLEELPARVAG